METVSSWKQIYLMGAKDPERVSTGFQLDERAVVVCRQLKDGGWEAWIEASESPYGTLDRIDCPIFHGTTRFKAQCKASRWYRKRSSQMTVCA